MKGLKKGQTCILQFVAIKLPDLAVREVDMGELESVFVWGVLLWCLV